MMAVVVVAVVVVVVVGGGGGGGSGGGSGGGGGSVPFIKNECCFPAKTKKDLGADEQHCSQCDQIGRSFAYWAIVLIRLFLVLKYPTFLGNIFFHGKGCISILTQVGLG
jgi:hypothetical protein